jgi:hypothetical protein
MRTCCVPEVELNDHVVDDSRGGVVVEDGWDVAAGERVCCVWRGGVRWGRGGRDAGF